MRTPLALSRSLSRRDESVSPNVLRHSPGVTVTRVPPADWTDPRHRDGWRAEIAAGRWLVRQGWRIQAHRYRLGRHDLDLIARRGDLVAFVEVKARRSDRCGAGEEAVGAKKRRVLERVAWSWILKSGAVGDQYRFDVVVQSGQRGGETLRHIEDAWRPGWR